MTNRRYYRRTPSSSQQSRDLETVLRSEDLDNELLQLNRNGKLTLNIERLRERLQLDRVAMMAEGTEPVEIDVFEGAGTEGLVPDPLTETSRFLRDDGTWQTPAGAGDMTKAVYDTDNDGLVDAAEQLEGPTAAANVSSASEVRTHLDSTSNPHSVTAAQVGALENVVEDTTPQLGGDLDANGQNIDFDDNTGIDDENGNEQVRFRTDASAANYLEVENEAAGNGPIIRAAGSDTNADLHLKSKGATGQVRITSEGNEGPVQQTPLGTPASDHAIPQADASTLPSIDEGWVASGGPASIFRSPDPQPSRPVWHRINQNEMVGVFGSSPSQLDGLLIQTNAIPGRFGSGNVLSQMAGASQALYRKSSGPLGWFGLQDLADDLVGLMTGQLVLPVEVLFSTDTSTNYNNAGGIAVAWDNEHINSFESTYFSHDNATNNSRLTVNVDGRFLWWANIMYESDGTIRQQLGARGRKNGTTNLLGLSVTGYARVDAAGSNDRGSVLIMGVEELSNGDYVEILTAREGAANTVNLVSGESTFGMMMIGT